MNVCVYVHTCVIIVLDQALAPYGPWDKYSLQPRLVNKAFGTQTYPFNYVFFKAVFRAIIVDQRLYSPKSQKHL